MVTSSVSLRQNLVGTTVVAFLCLVHLVWFVELFARGTPIWDLVLAWGLGRMGPDLLPPWGALDKADYWLNADSWQLASCVFVHGSLVHLLLNLWGLITLWPLVRLQIGERACLCLMLLGGVVGAWFSAVFGLPGVSMGVSGGLFALAGWLLVDLIVLGRPASGDSDLRVEDLSPGRLAGALLLTFVIGWAADLWDLGFRIDQWGHFGGLLSGSVFWPVTRRFPSIAYGLSVSSLVALVVCGPLGSGFRNDRMTADVELQAMEEGAGSIGADHLQRLLISIDDPDLLNDSAYRLALKGVQLPLSLRLVGLALAQRPGEPNYLDTKGWILCLTGEHRSGVALLRRAVAAFETVPEEVRLHLSRCEAWLAETSG